MALDIARRYVDAVPGWRLVEGEPPRLTRSLKFKDFAPAMEFVNEIAAIAEAEGHHPDIYISWNRVRLELVTHAIHGLSMNDFIMAAKINETEGGRPKQTPARS
jgi:4a-hydroxytetrahydrobiopterin dehydratase